MVKVYFTQNLRRHIASPPSDVPGKTVRAVLDAVFAENPLLKSYILDDQNALRKHIAVFVGSRLAQDRVTLADPVDPGEEIHVMQALSGG